MQFKRLIIFLLAALVLMSPGGLLEAAYDDFQTNADTTLTVGSINLTLKSGAKVQSLTVNTTNISVTLQSGSSMTLESSNRYELSTSGISNSSFSCPSSGNSVLAVSSPSSLETGTITISTSECTAPSSSGGGGGGGAPPPPAAVTPTNTQISVSAGATETTSSAVTLTLSATNASYMMISNKSDFAGASWETYNSSKSWTLTSGAGTKTVYVKYKSSTGNISSAISDSIVVVSPPATKTVTKSKGGTVATADKSASVSVPAGALSGDGSVSITPSSSYTALSGKQLVSGQVYDMKATVSGKSVTSFGKKLSLTFQYTADQVKGLEEGKLAIYYWDSTNKKWVKLGGTVDKTKKTVTVETDHFTLFAIFGETAYGSGDLVKLECDGTNQSVCTAVYYIGNDGKRYVFPNSKIYATWYDDFSTVKTISASGLAAYQIGGNVNYRPGVRMVKITSDPKTYAVAKNGVLRWVKTEAAAKALYGTDWNKKIDDLSDAFFFNYSIGKEITTSADYGVETQKASATTINLDKGL